MLKSWESKIRKQLVEVVTELSFANVSKTSLIPTVAEPVSLIVAWNVRVFAVWGMDPTNVNCVESKSEETPQESAVRYGVYVFKGLPPGIVVESSFNVTLSPGLNLSIKLNVI